MCILMYYDFYSESLNVINELVMEEEQVENKVI